MNLEKVLSDLNAEKRWLDGVIGAVEMASGSPGQQLIRLLHRSLWRGTRGHGLCLGARQKHEMAKLAQMVQQNGRRNGTKGRSS